MKNNLIISHGKCSDGLTAAYILQEAFGVKDEDVFFLEHTKDDTGDLTKQGFWSRLDELAKVSEVCVYVADYCLDNIALERILNTSKDTRVVILDHHKSALEDLNNDDYKSLLSQYKERIELYFDMRYSGAALAWIYAYGKEVLVSIVNDEDKSTPSYRHLAYRYLPAWLRYIMNRDIWQWVEEDARPFTDVFKNYCTELSHMRRFFPIDDSEVCNKSTRMMVAEGKTYRKMLNGQLELMEKDGVVKTFSLENEEMKVFLLNLPSIFASDMAQLIFDKYPEVDVFLGYRLLPNGVWDCSLRSRAGVDCSRIARLYQGGGHPQASGFKIKYEANIFTILNLK